MIRLEKFISLRVSLIRSRVLRNFRAVKVFLCVAGIGWLEDGVAQPTGGGCATLRTVEAGLLR